MKKSMTVMMVLFLFGAFMVSPLIMAGPDLISKIKLIDVKRFQEAAGLKVLLVDHSKQSLRQAIEEASDEDMESCFQTMTENYPELAELPHSAGYFAWEGKENYCMKCDKTKLKIKMNTVAVQKSFVEKFEIVEKTSFLSRIISALVPVALAGDRYDDGKCHSTPGYGPEGGCGGFTNPKGTILITIPLSTIITKVQSGTGGNPYIDGNNSDDESAVDNDDYCGPNPGEDDGNPQGGDGGSATV